MSTSADDAAPVTAAIGKEHRSEAGTVPVVRIGVSGHRPNRLADANLELLHEKARECLDLICKTAIDWHGLQEVPTGSPGPPRVISPLAEGSDRIVAYEALALGCELVCPLPFSRDEYERDFRTADSRREYRSLLRRASTVYELEGSRATVQDEEDSYAAVGELVLAESDVLIAVWNGREAQGSGGTERVVQRAVQTGVPVIWIEAAAPHETHTLVSEGNSAWRRAGLEHIPAAINGCSDSGHGVKIPK